MSQARAWAAGVAVVLMLAGATAPASAPASLGRESLATLRELGQALRAPAGHRCGRRRPRSDQVPGVRCASHPGGRSDLPVRRAPQARSHRRLRGERRAPRALADESAGIRRLVERDARGMDGHHDRPVADAGPRAYELLAPDMTPADRQAWESSMRRAADYLAGVMSPSLREHQLLRHDQRHARHDEPAVPESAMGGQGEDAGLAGRGDDGRRRVHRGGRGAIVRAQVRGGRRLRDGHVAVGARAVREDRRRSARSTTACCTPCARTCRSSTRRAPSTGRGASAPTSGRRSAARPRTAASSCSPCWHRRSRARPRRRCGTWPTCAP